MTGLAKAFAKFGAAGKNPRWSWSARSPDGKTVVMTMWKHRLKYQVKPVVYDTFGEPSLSYWANALGNRERLENLKWARDHCGGNLRVVITVAKDEHATKLEIAESFPQERMLMKLTALNEETGEFRAVMSEAV